jgi:hypothetical protein
MVLGKFFSLPQHLFLHPQHILKYFHFTLILLLYILLFFIVSFYHFSGKLILPKHYSDKFLFFSGMVILLEHFKKLYRFISLQSQLKYSTGTLFTSVPV